MSVLALALDARKATRRGPAAIATRQQARLAALVKFARQHSRYYADLYRDLPPDIHDLRWLPPLRKPDLMKRFDEWVTDPAVTEAGVRAFVADPSRIGERYLGRYLVWHTSGSTGDPVVLVHDQEAVLIYRALEIARAMPMWLSWRDLGTIVRRRGRVAALGCIDGHYSDTVWAACDRHDRPSRRRNTRMMSVRRPLMQLVRELNSFQPVVVFGYSSMLGLLAEEQEAGRLLIRPTMICTLAEPLPRTMRARIEGAFGCPVRETYSCSEALALAYSCDQGWLHPNADWMIIEPVDRFYKPTPPGQFSHSALITNLANRVQPILRYDLGDRVLLSPEPCSCGSPLPAIHVEGRTDDILAVPAPDGTTVHLAPLALTAAIEETPSVRRYQVIQSTPVRLVVRLEAVPPADERAVWRDVHERLRSYLRAQGLPNVILGLAEDPPAPDPRRGKFRHVWSELREETSGNSSSGAER